MSTVPPDVPDDVPTADYVDQHTPADPAVDVPTDPTPEIGADDLAAEAGTGRVETQQLGTDAEADEADLLEQAISVPLADEEIDEQEDEDEEQ